MKPYMASRTSGSWRIRRESWVTRFTSAPASISSLATSIDAASVFFLARLVFWLTPTPAAAISGVMPDAFGKSTSAW